MSYGPMTQNPFEDNMHDEIGGHSFNEAPPGFDDVDNDEILESGITGNLYESFSGYVIGMGNRGLQGSPSSSMEARSISSLDNEPRAMDWGEDNDADGEPELVDVVDGTVEQFIEVSNREDDEDDLYGEPVATAQQNRPTTTPKRPVPPPPTSAVTTRESSAASPEVAREGAPSPEPTAVP
jgi:hypothetical protein